MNSEAAICEFWQWFETAAPRLAAKASDPDTVAEVTRRLSELGDLAWEVGPGTNAENMFVISPDGDPELLHVTESIVSRAPTVPGWEFHSARPQRPLSEFAIRSDSGDTVAVDPRKWRYVLLRFPDGVFDIVIEQVDLVAANEEVRHTAAVVFLDGVLGEAERIRTIHDVETTVALSPNLALKSTSASGFITCQILSELIGETRPGLKRASEATRRGRRW